MSGSCWLCSPPPLFMDNSLKVSQSNKISYNNKEYFSLWSRGTYYPYLNCDCLLHQNHIVLLPLAGEPGHIGLQPQSMCIFWSLVWLQIRGKKEISRCVSLPNSQLLPCILFLLWLCLLTEGHSNLREWFDMTPSCRTGELFSLFATLSLSLVLIQMWRAGGWGGECIIFYANSVSSECSVCFSIDLDVGRFPVQKLSLLSSFSHLP